MKNANRQRLIDTDSEIVQDLGADIPFPHPRYHRRPVARYIVAVVLILLAAAAVGRYRMHRMETKCQVQMTVTLNNVVLEEGETYSVRPGDVILITAASSESTINRIGYYSNLNEEIRDTYRDVVSITVPEHPSGTKVVLVVEAVADNDNGKPNTVTKTGWRKFIFLYEP